VLNDIDVMMMMMMMVVMMSSGMRRVRFGTRSITIAGIGQLLRVGIRMIRRVVVVIVVVVVVGGRFDVTDGSVFLEIATVISRGFHSAYRQRECLKGEVCIVAIAIVAVDASASDASASDDAAVIIVVSLVVEMMGEKKETLEVRFGMRIVSRDVRLEIEGCD